MIFPQTLSMLKNRLARVLDQCREELSTWLNSNEISNERENATNDASGNKACSSSIKVQPIINAKLNSIEYLQ